MYMLYITYINFIYMFYMYIYMYMYVCTCTSVAGLLTVKIN